MSQPALTRPSLLEAALERATFQAVSPVDTIAARVDATLTLHIQQALSIYRDHGLPDRFGHYRRIGDGDWVYLGAELAPEARWEIICETPAGSRAHFTTLERLPLGQETSPQLQSAAHLLADCLALRECVREKPETAHTIELAMSAAVLSKQLQILPLPRDPLKFTDKPQRPGTRARTRKSKN